MKKDFKGRQELQASVGLVLTYVLHSHCIYGSLTTVLGVPVQVRRAQFLFRENFQPLDNDLLEFLTRITVPSPPVDFPIYSQLLGARGANTLCSPSAEGAPMNPDRAGPTEGKSFGRSAGFLACPQSVRAPAELWLHHKPVTGVDIPPQTGMAARTASRLNGHWVRTR